MTSTRNAAVILVGLVAAARPAEAKELRLEWRAPAWCATRSQAEQGLASIVGRPASELVGPWRRAGVAITPEEGSWRVKVAVVDRDGGRSVRELLTPTCEQARDAAIVILATSLVATERRASTGVQGSPSPATSVDQDTATASGELDGTARSSPSAARPREESLSGQLGIGSGVDLLTLPRVAAFGQLEARLERGALGVSAVALATDSAAADVAPGIGARMSLALAGALACYRPMASNPAPYGCAGAEAGVLLASGYGGTPARDDQAVWYAALAKAMLHWRLATWTALEVGAVGIAPLRTLKVKLGPSTVHETPPVGVRAWIATVARF
ncbi:MAG: hypothetical protein JW940_32025 [Polyangiaceae bacterium]|nr:hypothetical protein [Polyangiaceae bacterium]